MWTSPESREIWLSPVISIKRARKIVKVRPIYKTKAMKGEMGWENVKLGTEEWMPFVLTCLIVGKSSLPTFSLQTP